MVCKRDLLIRLLCGCCLVLILAGLIGVVAAFSGGRVGRSGNPLSGGGITCSQCHGGGEIPEVVLDGPLAVAPGTTVTYTLRISGGQEVAAGFNVSASTGEVAAVPGAADVQHFPWVWDNGETHQEVTHTVPKSADGNGVVTFAFHWTAPDEPGLAVLYGVGNSVDRNGSPIGDGADAVRLVVNAVSTAYLPVGLND